MNNHFNSLSPAEEAQLREDVHAVLEESEDLLTMEEIIQQVRIRQLQRVVDSLVGDGHATEVAPGRYTFTETGLDRLVRAS